jgi:succinyl-diaminopimelate desuccinylase
MKMDYSDAFARVEQEEEYIVDILRKIIAVDTSAPPGENYAKLIDVVEPEFQRFGFSTRRVVVPEDKVRQIPAELSGERCNLVASLKNGKPKASAYAHMDVVPVDEPWTVDPFGGEIIDGKLYGRGAVKGYEDFIFGGISGSTDLGLVADALKPEKVEVACFGAIRAGDIRAHAADEFVYVEDLITLTKELVHYFAF